MAKVCEMTVPLEFRETTSARTLARLQYGQLRGDRVTPFRESGNRVHVYALYEEKSARLFGL